MPAASGQCRLRGINEASLNEPMTNVTLTTSNSILPTGLDGLRSKAAEGPKAKRVCDHHRRRCSTLRMPLTTDKSCMHSSF
mmetsp:Transcript_18643/g.39064  ORF Transcript_18643/g.39064 Transcript_18643/m.39064 type:complete len:81 (+) Transcript_18643:204-446(+)